MDGKFLVCFYEGAGQGVHAGVPFLRNVLEKVSGNGGFFKEGEDLRHRSFVAGHRWIKKGIEGSEVRRKTSAETILLCLSRNLYTTVIDGTDLESPIEGAQAILDL